MKTLFKNVIKTAFVALILTIFCLPANAQLDNNKISKNTSLKTFRRISVSGNVEVTVVQSANEGITYAESSVGKVKVMQLGDLIMIKPAAKQIAKVILYVKDIYRIIGEDQAVINTEGELKTVYLQVFLKGKAIANLNSTSSCIYTILEDDSELDLDGSTAEQFFEKSKNSKLKMSSFACVNPIIRQRKNSLNRAEKLALVN